MAAERPRNVLLFVVDGLRTDALGCYGSALGATPNLDRFAGRAMRFEQCFCQHSVCMPTRASLFTGRYPHVHGVWANGCALSRDEVTLPAVLAEHGWATGAAGKVHFEPQQAYADHLSPIIGPEPYYGFDEVHLSENCLGAEYLRWIEQEHSARYDLARGRRDVPEEIHELRWITDQSIDFLARQASAGRPFFSYCSFHELVPPCTPPAGWGGHYAPADMPVPELRDDDLDRRPAWYRACYEGYVANGRQPDEPTLRRYIASYYDQLRFIDHQFGRLLETVDRLGLSGTTDVIFTADHGLSLNDHWQWRHGPYLFDQVVNVPLVWRTAGGGGVTGELVESIDLMPTILDRLGAPLPAGCQGTSLNPLLSAEPGAAGREDVLFEERCAPDFEARGLPPTTADLIGLRTTAWKLIWDVQSGEGELYDLRHDPGEFVNLWHDPAYRSQRAEMQARLMARLAAARDPLPKRRYGW